MCKKLSLVKYLSSFRICKTASVGSLSYQTALFSKSYTTL